MVLNVVRDRIREFGYPPSLRELCVALDLHSTHGISQHLDALERKGHIQRTRQGASRGIKLIESTTVSETQTVKVYSRTFEEGNVVDTIQVSSSMINKPVVGFLMRGDALERSGILDGDYLLVQRRGAFITSGCLVCLRVGDEISVRYYRKEGDYVRFDAAHPEKTSILVRNADFKASMLEGLVHSVYRKC